MGRLRMQRKYTNVFVLSLLAAVACYGATGGFSVRDFGAKGDGTTKDTAAIQAAIDKAASIGGTVILTPGEYISGTLHLKSNIELRIEHGARLVFSPSDEDFDAFEPLPYQMPAAREEKSQQRPANPTPNQLRKLNAPPAWDDTETSYAHYSLLVGDGVQHVVIDGSGEIDGNRPKRGGPKPICFKNSEWITIHGITVRNAPNYNISLIGTDHVEVEGVRLINGYADGIDPDNCHCVRITNCYIDAWDDAICPKASFALGKPRGTEHLVVANCILRTSCNHFKFGTETEGDLKNVSVTNCVMLRRDTGRPPTSGIAIESVDGANVDGIVISNVSIEDARAPIFIRLGTRARGMDKPAAGTIKNVLIQNVTATGADFTSSITGVDAARVQDVTIDGFTVTAAGGGAALSLEVPEVPTKYPDGDMFKQLPAVGLYARHVDGLILRDIKVRMLQPDERPSLIADDVTRLAISGYETANPKLSAPPILFRDVVGALLTGNVVTSPVETFLQVLGSKSGHIALAANELAIAHHEVTKGEDVPSGAVLSAK